ncbi:nucleotidyl transferase AbiEii/AbiGii toxin family protein [Acidobacteria bacterium AH-259-D05]|nr:nucleotidyl transferase AbiEii/AbiGii toxin family protein [Acidobacteria bacterium AH-259-D05]
MARQLELMKLREQKISELVEYVQQKSRNFKKPPIIMIGGYALRAFIPFSRYSRDCDFALPKGKTWKIDRIEKWTPELTVQSKNKSENSGYLRLIQLVKAGKRKIQVSLDFMEGEITGRAGERFLIDKKFLTESVQTRVEIGDKKLSIRVPSYQDYFLLKVLSARPSDIRDLAALIWKQGIPKPSSLAKRVRETVSEPRLLREKLQLALDDISHPYFLDSWRGTFITEEFTEKDKVLVLKKLRQVKGNLGSEGENA